MVTNSIVVLIICIFSFIPLILGEKARNSSVLTCSDFMVQRRQMGIMPMYATVFATWMSAFAFMGGIEYFYERGPIYMTTVGWDMLFAILFVLVGRRIWFYGKRHGYMTSVDFFDDIYDSRTLNILVTAINIIATLAYMQAQVVAAIIVFKIISGNTVSTYMAGIIFFVILCIYLWAGGLRAVAYTDIFYMILIIGAMLASGVFLAEKAGGIEYIFRTLADVSPEKVAMHNSQVPMWFSLFMIVPIGAFMGPQLWIRNYSAKSESNFNILPLLLGFTSIISVGTLLAGSACIILAGNTAAPDSILLVLMTKLAHPFFTIFIVIGIFAAIFSTANSQVHALASTFTLDIYRRYIDKTAPDSRLVRIAKWSIIVISLISYTFMVLVSEGFFDLAVFALGGTAQLMVPTAGALFWERSHSKAAIAGIISGEISLILLNITGQLDTSICALIGFLVNIVIFSVTSLALPRRSTVSLKITYYRKEYNNRALEN